MTDAEFEELFRDVYPRLVGIALALATPRSVADELAQETLIQAYRHAKRIETLDSPYAWCRRVMTNLLIDQHRSRTAERSALDRLSSVDRPGPPEPIDDPTSKLRIEEWLDLIAPLSPRQRSIATLFYAEDRSVSEIAADLGVSTGSVKTTLSRVRQRLATELDATERLVQEADQ